MDKMQNKNVIGAALALCGGLCWAVSGSVGQYLFTYEDMDSRWLVPIRLGIAGVLLLLYCLKRFGANTVMAPWKDPADRKTLLLYGIAGISGSNFFYFTTIMYSTAGIGTIMQDLSPVCIMLYLCVRQKRLPSVREVGCILLALFGVVLISTHGDLSQLAIPVMAILSGMASAICVMIYNVVPRSFLSKYPMFLLQGWAFFLGGIVFSVIFHPWTWHYTPSAIGVLGIVVVILVGNILAFNLYQTGVKMIGPAKAVLYGFSEPIFAAVLGVICFHGIFTVWDGIGFAAVFVMMVLIG